MQIDATTALHAVSQCLSAPTIALLLLFAAFAVYTLGSFVYEIVAERRHYKVALPALIDDVDAASFGELQGGNPAKRLARKSARAAPFAGRLHASSRRRAHRSGETPAR